jgi:hypothetical protein
MIHTYHTKPIPIGTTKEEITQELKGNRIETTNTLTKLKKKNGYQVLVIKSKEEIKGENTRFTFKTFKVKMTKLMKPAEIRIKLLSKKMHLQSEIKLLKIILKERKDIIWKLNIVKRELFNTKSKELTNGIKLKFLILEVEQNNRMEFDNEVQERAHIDKLQTDLINIINQTTKSQIASAYTTEPIEDEKEKKEDKKETNKKRKFEVIQ